MAPMPKQLIIGSNSTKQAWLGGSNKTVSGFPGAVQSAQYFETRGGDTFNLLYGWRAAGIHK